MSQEEGAESLRHIHCPALTHYIASFALQNKELLACIPKEGKILTLGVTSKDKTFKIL